MNEDELFDGALEEYIHEHGKLGLHLDFPRCGGCKKICLYEDSYGARYACTLQKEASSGAFFIWIIHRHVLKSDNDLPVKTGERWGLRMNDVVAAVAAGKMTEGAIPLAVDLLL